MAEPRAAGRSRRTTGADASSTPRYGLRPRGARASSDPYDDTRIGWSRRIGVGLALVCLGGTIVLAGSGALDSGAKRNDPSAPAGGQPATPTPTGLPSPTLVAPSIEGSPTILTRQTAWTLTVLLPQVVPQRRETRLSIYRGERVVAERGVRRGERMRVNVPLRRGRNELTAALTGPSGTSPPSAAIVVTRDDVAPRLRILAPSGGSIVNAATAIVHGSSEPGVSLMLRNETTGDVEEAVVGTARTFDIVIGLERGSNELALRGQDEAGNASFASVVVTRGEGQALAQLTLSDAWFRIARLPATITLQVAVLDADGAPVDGAPVTFSLSPPGLPTSTYRTTTADGAASWANVTFPAEGALAGRGLATVQVTLGDGTTVRESVPFQFR